MHAFVGNKYLRKTVTAYSLVGSLKAQTVLSINIERTFAIDGKKICLQTTELLLHVAANELEKAKKFQYWTSINTVLLLVFLTENALTDRETVAEVLLKIFSKRINKQEA